MKRSGKRSGEFSRGFGIQLGPFFVLLLTSSACERDVPEEPRSKPVQEAVATEAPPPKTPPGNPGDWIESLRYKLRVLQIKACELAPGEISRKVFRLGVSVEVQATPGANVSDVVASPKAAILEKNGKIFEAVMKPEPSPGCETPLVLSRLRPGEAASGVLVFEAPAPDYLEGSVLAFQPPRWGGEVRIEVQLPDCLKDCPGPDESDTEEATLTKPAAQAARKD